MNTVLTVLHVLVCIFLVAVVLLQRGKGAEIGAVFGGGASSTVFGGRGAGNFLTKLTTASAIIFMLTSLSLSYLATTTDQERLFDGEVEDLVEKAEPFEELGTAPTEAAGEPDAGAGDFVEIEAPPAAESPAPEAGEPAPPTP